MILDGPASSRATRPPTDNSGTRSRRLASIAGRHARRAWPIPETSSCTTAWKAPGRPGSGLAGVATRADLRSKRRTQPWSRRHARSSRKAKKPSLKDLADAVGRSPSYFHRAFKAVIGLTPKDYAAAHRAKKIRQGLASSNTITEAIYDAGFNSSGRFYEKSTDLLGMRPSRYRAGGADEEIKFAVGQTSLGAILVASSRKGVAAILLGDDPDELVRDLQDRFPKARLIGAERDYETLIARVGGLIETPEVGLSLPLDVRGTAFQQRVWQALQEIPTGETVCYAEIARRIGSPKAARAVAEACAANNLAVAIPCHRVVRHDGSLSGYAWGVDRKRALLDREASRST
jgi:AraC family transcriptional regulator, regulatory protein of adaptative response / methylated-DNA-[protein]-cysteine methyltransferase